MGAGAAKRRSPTGGLAYGTPRYSYTQPVSGATWPVTAPLVVDTVSSLSVAVLLQPGAPEAGGRTWGRPDTTAPPRNNSNHCDNIPRDERSYTTSGCLFHGNDKTQQKAKKEM